MNASEKREGKVDRVTQTTSSPRSALFKASFLKGAIEAEVMADKGSDTNFLSEQLLKKILKATSGAS